MQIGIFSDVHANLPALQAVSAELRDCDELVHLGDAISIGHFHASVSNCCWRRKT